MLLDRDGVINEDLGTWVQRPEDFQLIPGVGTAIAALNKAGHSVAIVTNQSCVGRGMISMDTLELMHKKMIEELAEYGAHIDKIYVAPDDPSAASDRRKPGPGMLLEAMDDFAVTADETVMIGDSLTDMQAAVAAGVKKKILVVTGHGMEVVGDAMEEWALMPPVFVVPSLGQFGALPPDVLPVSIHNTLNTAIKEAFTSSFDADGESDESDLWGVTVVLDKPNDTKQRRAMAGELQQ